MTLQIEDVSVTSGPVMCFVVGHHGAGKVTMVTVKSCYYSDQSFNFNKQCILVCVPGCETLLQPVIEVH